jgi:hypothetical protein
MYNRMFLAHQLGALKPSLRQAVPDLLVLPVPREFGHDFAFSSKSQEPVRRVHHETSVLMMAIQHSPERIIVMEVPNPAKYS